MQRASSLPRARQTIPSHFHIPSSGQLGPIFTRTILNVGHATPPVVFPQIDTIRPKSGYEFWEGIVSRGLRLKFPFRQTEGEQEGIMEDCDGWISDIVLHTRFSVFTVLSTAFSLCQLSMGTHILFLARLSWFFVDRCMQFALEE